MLQEKQEFLDYYHEMHESAFGCRHCYGLTYESSQQNHKYDRVMEHLEGLDEANLTINQVLRLGGL